MSGSKFNAFAQRHPTLGPWLWLAGLITYFIVQIIVAAAWPRPYSLAHDFISDLGNTACTTRAGAYICSPLHGLMNGSLVIIGLALILGAALVYCSLAPSWQLQLSFALVIIAGIGTVIVGFIPENSSLTIHSWIAGIGFICLNLGVVTFYFVTSLPRPLRLFALISGSFGFFALALFGLVTHPVIGKGTVERIADYTPDIWLFTFGVYALIKAKHTLRSHQAPANEQ